MSGVAIPYRSDAQCVKSEQVGCLSLFVCLPVDFTSPIPSFKHKKYFLSPFLPDWRPLSLSLSLTFFIIPFFSIFGLSAHSSFLCKLPLSLAGVQQLICRSYSNSLSHSHHLYSHFINACLSFRLGLQEKQ